MGSWVSSAKSCAILYWDVWMKVDLQLISIQSRSESYYPCSRCVETESRYHDIYFGRLMWSFSLENSASQSRKTSQRDRDYVSGLISDRLKGTVARLDSLTNNKHLSATMTTFLFAIIETESQPFAGNWQSRVLSYGGQLECSGTISRTVMMTFPI